MKDKQNINNRASSSGFTLIELLAVMVILGILAAAALPQFVDLTGEAQNASVKAMAGSVESASNLNHAVNLAVKAGLSSDKVYGTKTTCAAAAQLLTITQIDTGIFTFANSISGTDGTPNTCTVKRSDSSIEDFQIIAATAAN